jgi:hypothetical protein
MTNASLQQRNGLISQGSNLSNGGLASQMIDEAAELQDTSQFRTAEESAA